jgi:formylglycine-generating enzyme required for sulfatase activity
VPARLLDLPVTGVTVAEAEAFARWAGKRLPTEREWERAAQGAEARRYPYGDELDLSKIHVGLAPVGTKPEGATSEGVHDLTGNGWEWTASPFVPYGTKGTTSTARTIRGGYDPARPRSGSATFRAGLRADVADPLVGFRCAR